MAEILKVAEGIGDYTVLVIIAAAVIFLAFKYFSNLIDEKAHKKAITVEHNPAAGYDSVAVLKDLHPYFNKINGIIDIKLPITKIGGPVRTEIFRDILKIFYETQLDITYTLLKQNITKENFLSLNVRATNNVVKMSNERMTQAGIPETVRRKFWEWNNKRHDYIISTLSDIDSSTVFSSVIEKEYAALNLYQSCSYFVLVDAENTLKNLNGDLTGTVYNGKKVEGLHD